MRNLAGDCSSHTATIALLATGIEPLCLGKGERGTLQAKALREKKVGGLWLQCSCLCETQQLAFNAMIGRSSLHRTLLVTHLTIRVP